MQLFSPPKSARMRPAEVRGMHADARLTLVHQDSRGRFKDVETLWQGSNRKSAACSRSRKARAVCLQSFAPGPKPRAILGTADGGWCRGGLGFFFFLRGFTRRSSRRGRAGAAARVKIELAHLVQQRLIADAEHARRILAAPVGAVESVGDRLHLGFIFQAANQRLQALL